MAKLDRIIQTAMGWTNGQLHESEVIGKRDGTPEDVDIHDAATLDDRRHKLGVVLGAEVTGFKYACDFGDNWRHTVIVEDRLLPAPSLNNWPLCIAGQNDGPPEDVGGVGGYTESLEAISAPSQDEPGAMRH